MLRKSASIASAVVALTLVGACDGPAPTTPPEEVQRDQTVGTQSSLIQGPTEVEAGERVLYTIETGYVLDIEPSSCYWDNRIFWSWQPPYEKDVKWIGDSESEGGDCVTPYTGRVLARESYNGPVVDSLLVSVTGLWQPL
ncbi:MAG: hypothetical protein ACODAE_01605 [Gemmatimonadota bacterium]